MRAVASQHEGEWRCTPPRSKEGRALRGGGVRLVLRQRRNELSAFLYAFDLLELNGTDMRREPIEVRKATLASILRKARHGVRIATVRANGVLSISMMTVAATSRSSPVLRPRGGRAITSRRSNLVALV